jgi:HSP20 family protein
MVSRFLTPFGGKSPREAEDTFLELPHELNQVKEENGGSSSSTLVPRLGVYESDRVIEMTAELPGVAEEDIELNLDGDILTISGAKHDTHEGKKVHFSERSYGTFHRSIQLPFAPDPDRMDASSDSGVLTIRFPRVEQEKSRRIPIRGLANVDQPQSNRGSRRAIGGKWKGEEPRAEEPRVDDELKLSADQAISEPAP